MDVGIPQYIPRADLKNDKFESLTEMELGADFRQPIFKQKYITSSSREDGLLLKVHHTAPGPTGDIRRTQFNFASFSFCDELLALADHRGNIYVVDLANSVFWFLGKRPSVTLLSFHPHKKKSLFVGTGDTNLMLLNAGKSKHSGSLPYLPETNHQVGILAGHTETPSKLSFSSDGKYCLSAARSEGFIWDLQTLSQAHRLNLQPSMTIKQAIFMPVSNNILACFQDDAIHIWAFQSFQCIKQIIPDSWKGHNIKSIAFTRNGGAMVVAGASRQLVIFTVDSWDTQRVVTLPDVVSRVLHVEFLPQSFDLEANQVLLVLADSGLLLFVDVAKETCVTSTIEKDTRSFTCSWSGKYVVCNTLQGEAKIFSGYQLLANANKKNHTLKVEPPHEESAQILSFETGNKETRKGIASKKQISKINQQIGIALDVNRLRPILKEFYEYPEQYRSLIWRSILQLPGNQEPWKSLSLRPLHASAQILAETIHIQNKTLFSCLQSVISCLAHWSPVFGELPYLPHFIFPFVKVFHSDKFVCFEVAVTLIVNWCQHWFEYLSFPPINILSMIENLLSEHDSILVSVFCNIGVTSRQYAWALLSSAFSEVLTTAQWKQLWDHIISNPPWFLLFAVVAYNICCRASLKTCSSKKDFEFFFRNQNPIDMKLFIKKCYELMEKTSEDNHPKHYFKTFMPLPKGNYPVFSEFPKYIVNYQKEQRDAICQEEEKVLREQHRILSQRLAREETRVREKQARTHEARLLEAEKAANDALRVEETRLIERRRQLAALRREIQLQEEQSSAAARVETMEHQLKQRSAELDRLHYQLYEKAKQSGLDKENLNDEIHEQFKSLHVKKQELKERLSDYNLRKLARPLIENMPSDEVWHLKEQQRLLSDEIQKLRKESSNQGIKACDVDVKIAEVDSLQQRVEIALARRAFAQEECQMYADQCQEEVDAAKKVKKLQNEVELLTQQLASISRTSDVYPQCDNDTIASKLSNFKKSDTCNMTSQSGALFSLRSCEFYKREKSAVSSAMDIRRSLLSSLNTT